MKTYRSLTQEEIQQLKERSCTAVDWDEIEVVENFKTDYIYHTRFSGKVRLGVFEDEFTLAGGMRKHSGLYHATLHNVTVGDNCCIENIKNYIANYIIGDYAIQEKVLLFYLFNPLYLSVQKIVSIKFVILCFVKCNQPFSVT